MQTDNFDSIEEWKTAMTSLLARKPEEPAPVVKTDRGQYITPQNMINALLMVFVAVALIMSFQNMPRQEPRPDPDSQTNAQVEATRDNAIIQHYLQTHRPKHKAPVEDDDN